jgi:hypothetical protein
MSPQPPQANYSFVPLDEDGLQVYSSWLAAGELKQWAEPPTRK